MEKSCVPESRGGLADAGTARGSRDRHGTLWLPWDSHATSVAERGRLGYSLDRSLWGATSILHGLTGAPLGWEEADPGGPESAGLASALPDVSPKFVAARGNA
jgi:hypothetical protein